MRDSDFHIFGSYLRVSYEFLKFKNIIFIAYFNKIINNLKRDFR